MVRGTIPGLKGRVISLFNLRIPGVENEVVLWFGLTSQDVIVVLVQPALHGIRYSMNPSAPHGPQGKRSWRSTTLNPVAASQMAEAKKTEIPWFRTNRGFHQYRSEKGCRNVPESHKISRRKEVCRLSLGSLWLHPHIFSFTGDYRSGVTMESDPAAVKALDC